jgi:hypothetical protein
MIYLVAVEPNKILDDRAGGVIYTPSNDWFVFRTSFVKIA